jgi:chitodextrinase
VVVLTVGAVVASARGGNAALPMSFLAAQGQLTSPATTVPDATGGQAVQFNPPVPDSAGFVHPGVLLDESQLNFVRNEIAASAAPWTGALAALNPFYATTTWVAKPVATLDCSANAQGCSQIINDSVAAYTLALLYSYSTAPDRAKYADTAITIMNAWSSTVKKSNGNQSRLTLAWVSEVFPRAAEILRYTFASGATDPVFNVAAFTTMLNAVFEPAIAPGDPLSNGNWELSMADGLMNIGVFTDSRTVFNAGVAMWRARVPAYIYLSTDNNGNGQPVAPPGGQYSDPSTLRCFWLGIGTNKNTCKVPTGFTYYDGMTQETCRDMSHPVMGLDAMMNGAETARLQGVDLYGEQKQRIADAYEFAAAFDNQYLTTGVWPATPCGGRPGSFSGQGGDGTGGRTYVDGWEIGYNEFVNRLGMAMPNTAAMISRVRPTGGVNASDWETLTNAGVSLPAGCATPDARSGTDLVTVTVPSDGVYRLWSRIEPTTSANTSLALQTDNGCAVDVGGAGLPTGQWTWIDYQNGDSASKVNVTLTAGTHSVLLTGISAGLSVDSVMLVADPTCVPIDTGANCLPDADTTPPTTDVTAPVDATTVSGVVPLTAGAADDTAVARVDFLVGSTVVGSTTTSPYTVNWDTTAGPDGPYTIESRAYDAAGNATTSVPVSVTVFNNDTQPPSAPTGIVATATSATSVGLSWTAATDNLSVVGYAISRDGSPIGTTTATTYSDPGLTQLTAYTYTVTAADGAGNIGPPSDPSSVTTPDGTAPTAPTGVLATLNSDNSVAVSWSAASDNVGVTRYLVLRNGVQVGTTSGALSFTDATAAAGMSYAYTVEAVDGAGNTSSASIAFTVTTPSAADTTPPTAPGTLTATVTSFNQITVTWTTATDNVGVTAYRLSHAGVQISQSSALTFTDSNLAPATSYTYSVIALDAAGNSSAAKTVTISTPLAAAPPGAGWAGAYFNNATLSGSPIGRLDSTVNFLWGSAAPMAGIPADNFSVRWTGQLTPATTGTYTFYTQTNDGVRLYVNNTLLINGWTGGAANRSAKMALTKGTAYNMRMEYYDATGTATAQLFWSGPSITKAAVPASVMKSSSAGLLASFFSTTNLVGTPSLVRIDSTINDTWGTGSPDSRIPVDNFSARWTGKITPPTTGTYTFYTDSIGGVRVTINGQLIVNNWTLHALTTNTGTIALTAGTSYNITLEYQVGTGSAEVKMSWSNTSFGKTIVPQSALRDR